VKALTTIVARVTSAVITRRPTGYFIAHVEGEMFPTVNGSNLGSAAIRCATTTSSSSPA